MRSTDTTSPTLTLPELYIPLRPRSGHRRPRTCFRSWENTFARASQCRNRSKNNKRKHEVVIKNEEELEGENVIYKNGEKVDLNLVARVGDGAYERELESMTQGMSRVQLVGFMDSLEGEWCHRSERRKVVVAAEIVKVLPVDWKIEIAVRRRAQLCSLYCRSYVSPTGMQFKSCKEAAAYLRDQSSIDVAGPSKQGEMRQINNGSRVLLKSINELTNSSTLHEANNNLLHGTNDLYDVEIGSFIDCSPCGLTFDDIAALNKHLAIVHNKTTRRFELPKKPPALDKAQVDRGQHAVVGQDESRLGEASSSSQKMAGVEAPVAMVNNNNNGRFRTKCTWCNKEFLCEPVDAETMADAAGFMCPECKDKLWGVPERSLSRAYQQ
ncbi:putative transcription factor C2H2 family [Helianthus anomalus]